MIDDDLGQSGTTAENRVGFQRLLAEIGLPTRIALCAVSARIDDSQPPNRYLKRRRGFSGCFNPEGFGLLAERANAWPKKRLEQAAMIWYSIRLFMESSVRALREGSLMFVVDEPLQDNLRQLVLYRSGRKVSAKV